MTTAPLAFSGSRLHWSDLPREIRTRIAELADADVISETSATSGFSPGYAAVLGLSNGTEVFVKAVSPEQNPDSPGLARREIAVAGVLPPEVCAPHLWWHHDDGAWVLLGFQPVDGRAPEMPWRPVDLARALGALTDLAEYGTPAPRDLPAMTDAMASVSPGWALLADDGAALTRAVGAVGPHGDWVTGHLDELVALAGTAPAASAGDTLVHGDLRADNVMLAPAPDDRVWLIDWPHTCRDGARWWDLVGMLPSVAMQDGGDPQTLFWEHPNAQGADRDAVRAVLAAITGFFVHGSVQPPPTSIPNLREFQLAQAIAALDWLRRI